MKKNKRIRAIQNVSEDVWRKFSAQAKLLGVTHAEFLQMLLEIYLKNEKRRRDKKEDDLNILIKKLEDLANSKTDGHFMILKFTTHWKACLGTPNLDTGEGREQVWDLKSYNTLAEAIKGAIKNN